MLWASVYIACCSLRNRVMRRLARLRDPRYLLGAIAGGAYLVFMISQVGGNRRRRRRSAEAIARDEATASGLLAVAPALTGLPMAAMAGAAWLMPFDSGLLDFSKPETNLLFPAPVPRWKLLVHRLIRSQPPLLLSAVVPSLLIPLASPFARLRFAIGMWVILMTGKLYFTAVALTRVRFRSPRRPERWMARSAMTISLIAVGVIAVPIIMELNLRPPDDLEDGLMRAGAIASSGFPSIALWPVTALSSLLFAPTPGALAAALPSALVVFFVMLVWALASADVFPDAAEVAVANREVAARAPQVRNQRARAAWTLSTSGRPELAFAWKSATEAARSLDWRLGLILGAFVTAGIMSGHEATLRTIAVMATMGASFVVLIAPQTYRADIRRDLAHLDQLKTWPVAGASVVRGTLIWPVVAMTVLAWPLMGIALTVADAVFEDIGGARRAVFFGAAATIAPALIAVQYSIHTATALLFPAWVQIGRRRPRGLEVAGQRMVTMAVTWVVMAVALAPGALAGGMVWFAAGPLAGDAAWIAAAAVCALVLLVEVLAATEILGPLYERLDLTGIERPET